MGPPTFGNPRVTISSLPQYGVVLLPSTSEEFGQLVKRDRIPSDDYVVVVRNQSAQDIIAYSLVWNCADAIGKLMQPQVAPYTLSTKHLAPQSSEVIGVDVDKLRQTTVTVHISLEAVLFDDGALVGPDAMGWGAKWKAQIEAEQEVFNKAVDSTDEDRSVVLRSLAEPAIRFVQSHGGWSATAGNRYQVPWQVSSRRWFCVRLEAILKPWICTEGFSR